MCVYNTIFRVVGFYALVQNWVLLLHNEKEEDAQMSERRRKKKTHKKTLSVPFHHVGETKLSIQAASSQGTGSESV